MENQLNLSKFRKIALILDVILTITFWATIIFAILSLAAGIVSLFFKDISSIIYSADSSTYKISFDGLLMYRINSSQISKDSIREILTTTMLTVSALSFAIAPVFKQASLILKTVAKEDPFSKDNAKRLSRIAGILFINAFVINIGEGAISYQIVSKLKLDAIDVNFAPNSYLIIAALIIYVLSGVFKYGAFLQQEHNETV